MLRATRRSSSSGKQLSGGCAVLFGLPFILAGLACGVFIYWPMISSWWSARTWVEVPCWIETAELKTSRGKKGGTNYGVEARYRYEFDRQKFHGDEVSLFGGSDNMGDFQKQAFQQIQLVKGKERPFRCFVNPAKPEQTVLFRDLRWGLLLIMSLFPMLFPLAGFLVSISGWQQSRKQHISKKLAAQYPGEPWRWRAEWAGDAIHATKDGLPFILAVAGWILVVQLPLALAVVLQGELAKSALALSALLPALLAGIPLFFAWKRVKARRILGRPSLQLKQLPARPGSALVGHLRFDRVFAPMTSITVRVLCQRHITRRSGDSQTTATETIWEHTETRSASETWRDGSGVTLPLNIEIPYGLPCSTLDEASIVTTEGEQHVWTLEISSSQGSNPAILPLPMFAAEDEAAATEFTETHPAVIAVLSTDDLILRLKARGLHPEFDSNGIPTSFDCPASRNRGISTFLLMFGTLWFAAFVFMSYQGAPLIFRLVWGISAPLILGMGVWMALHSRRVEIRVGELRILNRVGPFYSWQESFEPRHLTAFTHDSNLQSNNQFFYRVRAETIFGKKKTLFDGITESVTAEALAKRLEQWRKRVTES